MKLQFYISAKIIRKSTEQIIYTLDTSISLEVQTLVSKQINNFTFLTTHRSINKLSDIFDVLARGDRTYVGVAVHIEQISLPLLEWAKAGWVPSDQILAAILDVAVAAATQATTAVTAIHTLRTEADTGTEITGQKQHYQQIHQRCALAWIRTPKAFSMVKTLCLEFIAIGGGPVRNTPPPLNRILKSAARLEELEVSFTHATNSIAELPTIPYIFLVLRSIRLRNVNIQDHGSLTALAHRDKQLQKVMLIDAKLHDT